MPLSFSDTDFMEVSSPGFAGLFSAAYCLEGFFVGFILFSVSSFSSLMNCSILKKLLSAVHFWHGIYLLRTDTLEGLGMSVFVFRIVFRG